MTICLPVAEVIAAPWLFEQRFRLAAIGVLIVDDHRCRLHKADADGGWDDDVFLDVDDDVAIAAITAALGTGSFVGAAMIQAWTRVAPDRVTLVDVVDVVLEPDGARREIHVREQPWG